MSEPRSSGVWTFFRYSRMPNSASPGGRFENSPLFQGWVRKEGAPSPEGTVELLPQITLVVSDFTLLQQGEKLFLKTPLPVMLLLVQPSLRDLFHREFEPTLERVGYSRISLREIFGHHSSADLQSAVSQDCILQDVRQFERSRFANALPIANRRYGRLQVCATTARGASHKHGHRGSCRCRLN